ncbi:MAG: MoaD/ThiS family protein [Burkholderiales bacterium]|nr:MoaD/ThiS family protein [Burkholderiales bacterium]
MISVEFAPALQRHVPCPAQKVGATILREALVAALSAAPALSHYVFDDQGAIRKHVAVFVNDELVRERVRLDRRLADGDRVMVIQALSGG